MYNIETPFKFNEIRVELMKVSIIGMNSNSSCLLFEISAKFIQKYVEKYTPIIANLINN